MERDHSVLIVRAGDASPGAPACSQVGLHSPEELSPAELPSPGLSRSLPTQDRAADWKMASVYSRSCPEHRGNV